MDWLMLRSLPAENPQSLVVLNRRMAPGSGRKTVMHGMSGSTWMDRQSEAAGIFPYPAFELIRTQGDSVFSNVFAYYPTRRVNFMRAGIPFATLPP